MRIKIPFTNKTLHLGTKAVESAKRAFGYGVYNTWGDLSQSSRVRFDVLYQIYNNLVDVKQAIRKLQNATMKGGYSFLDSKGQTLDMTHPEVAKVEEVINTGKMQFTTLKDLWVRDLNIAGNSFWHIQKNIEGNAMEIVPIDPRTMSIVTNKFGDVLFYKQRVMGSVGQEFDEDEVVHSVMDFSTRNPVLGVSPIEAIIMDAKTEMESQKSNLFFYENQGVPAHLLIVDENLTSDQVKELKEEMDKQYKGAKNRFKAGIIPFLKDIKTIALSQKDMKYLETRQFNTKKIVVAFGVDAFILGYTEKVQRGNADIIYKGFYENAVRPFEILFEEKMNKEILPALGAIGITFKVNLSNYDNKKEVAEISRNDVTVGIMTINEARQLRGLEENENELADDLLYQGLLIDDLGEEVQEIRKAFQARMDKKHADVHNLLEND